MDAPRNQSHDPEKISDQPVDDPELLNQPPFNIPPGRGGSRPEASKDKTNGLLTPPGPGSSPYSHNEDKSRTRSSLAGLPSRWRSTPRLDGKRELTEDECYDKLAYSWPKWKKWGFLSVIACVQISMNFNTSVFPNAVTPLSEHFGVSEQAARVGQCVYLVLYSFGCELWAPWSEEFGRWPVLQLSMFLINIWQLPAAFAPNFGSVVVARALVCLMGCVCISIFGPSRWNPLSSEDEKTDTCDIV